MDDAEYIQALTSQYKQNYNMNMNMNMNMKDEVKDEVKDEHVLNRSFIKSLMVCIRKLPRQPVKVNLFLTQLIVTVAMVAPPEVFVELFLDQHTSFSITMEIDKV